MPSNNKYGSIVETFLSDPILNILLSSKATPPADLNLVAADFTLKQMYSMTTGGIRRGNFALNDTPRILGIGLWCNLSDGLVQISSPDTPDTELNLQLALRTYNSAGAAQQLLGTMGYKVQEFNQIYDVDFPVLVSGITYSMTGNPAATPTGYMRIEASMPSVNLDFSMITIDPAFAAKRLIMRPMVVIEHTFPMLLGGF